MKVSKNSIGLCYALLNKLHSSLLWVSSPDYVKNNKVAVIGLLNKAFNVTKYINDIYTAAYPGNNHLDDLMRSLIAEHEAKGFYEVPWPE